MNPKANINGKEVELISPDDWTTRELANAERVLQMPFDGTSAGAGMAITLYISLRRVEPDKPEVLLADEVLDMKFSVLQEATAPLGEGTEGESEAVALEDQQTSGLPLSVPSESPSTLAS